MRNDQERRRPATGDDGSGTLVREMLCRRYLLKDKLGSCVETPDEMFRRVAKAVAQVETGHQTDPALKEVIDRSFYEMMACGQFLPNSPALMNAGRKNGLLSACFVLPVEDSIDGIFRSVSHTALIQRAGGGTGFTFDLLRPTGDLVASSGGRTSGPISFMRVFAETTNAIQQGAFRRGANMGMMSMEHPDILKFITAKGTPGSFANFNFSVKVSDQFMQALADRPNEPHMVVNPRTGQRYVIPKDIDLATYAVQDLIPVGSVSQPCLTIRDLWSMVVRGAHATGEPGVCFIDTINKKNPTPHLGRIEATNPCGEQPLLPYEACCLGSINLVKFVKSAESGLDWEELGRIICYGTRFLDDLVDANDYPIPEIGQVTAANRKIGLGVMGFADALVLLGIRYDSDQAVELAGKVARFLTETAHETSEKLAGSRDSFPNWQGSVWDTEHHRPMRNAACTTIAPTGSISLITGCSSGIEPLYSIVTKRRALDGKEFVEIHPLIERLGREQGWLDAGVRAALLDGRPAGEIPGFPKQLAEVLVTAHEVAPEWHVRVQAAFQTHVDNAVSKTVNMPAGATVEDVDKVFRMAYELGCKGITVYRDGSRQGQTLSTATKTSVTEITSSKELTPRPRVRVTQGQTYKERIGCGTIFTTVNRDAHGACEVFAVVGKNGGCQSQSEATCRAVSIALRSGVDPAVLVEQLKGIRCLATCLARKENKRITVSSCPDAIARAIEEALGDAGDSPRLGNSEGNRTCPFCRFAMRREAGCFVCDQCMHSSCG